MFIFYLIYFYTITVFNTVLYTILLLLLPETLDKCSILKKFLKTLSNKVHTINNFEIVCLK